MITMHVLNASQQPEGPFTIAELKQMLKVGRVTWKTMAARAGDDEWLPLVNYEDLLRPPVRVVASPVVDSGMRKEAGFDLTKAGGIILAIGLVLSIALGLGLVEMILLAAGIVLLVVGLCRK